MFKRLTLTYLIFLATITLVFAQENYPIYVTPTLIPPYSLKLSDYSKFGSQNLMVTLTVKDLTVSNLPVKLRIKMEAAGVVVENPPTINTTPIYLDGGTTSMLFGDNLTDYFNIDNLIFKGYSKETYRSTGQLPEGFYKFTIEVLHFQTNKVISNQGTAIAWIAVGKPPVLKSPENNAQMGEYKGMPLTFTWLPSNVGSPVSTGTIQYKFEMWEMRIAGISPYTVASSMPVFHEYTTFNSAYTLYTDGLLMEPGMEYAWRVTASDISGFVPFEQDGHSEVRVFTYKESCDSVFNLTSSALGTVGIFSWQPEENHTSFNVEIRNPLTGWSTQSQTYENKAEFYDLKYGSTYELRVQSVCDGESDNTGDFSHWQKLTIPEQKPLFDSSQCPTCGCNDSLPNVVLTNFELREDLKAGDTIANKTGTTRFILKAVEPVGNGTYKGIFLFWAEIWNLKFICEYWDLQVNTDDVIVNMGFESVYNPQFLLDVDAATDYLNNLADAINDLTINTSISDTLSINGAITSIYVNAGDSVMAVTIDENGNVQETVIHDNVDDLSRTLIQGENGEEYVVTRNGEVMGVDEYKNTGGDGEKIDEMKEDNETNKLSSDETLTFTASQNQQYGFDSYTEIKSAIQDEYPSLQNGYRAPFKSVASYGTDKVGFSEVSGDVIFKDEMGIPALKSGNELTVRGSADGSEMALYAWQAINDSTEEIIGKLNIMSYDEQPKRVFIVPVNGASVPNVKTLEKTLNSIYSQAVTKWTVDSIGGIENVVFENGNMTHGGTSVISTYNADQKTIVNAFENQYGNLESDAYYLFFVENVQYKERSIAGYMPLQRQVGFIYDNPGLNIVAHELGHGAFNLYHTFSDENFIATEQTTNNLLDYKGGTELWKHQWNNIHNPENVLFAFLQDEEEGEMKVNSQDIVVKINGDDFIILSNEEAFQVVDLYYVEKTDLKFNIYQSKDTLKPQKADIRIESGDKKSTLRKISEYQTSISRTESISEYFFDILINPNGYNSDGTPKYEKEIWIKFRPAKPALCLNKGTRSRPEYLEITDGTKVYGEDSVQIKAFLLEYDDLYYPDTINSIKKISIETDSISENLSGWNTIKVKEKTLNKILTYPTFGDSSTWQIETVDAPVVTLTRKLVDYDGSYGLDNYETFKNYKTKFDSEYESNKITIDESDYFLADIIVTNNTDKMNPVLFPVNKQPIDGICKYYFNTKNGEKTVTIKKINYTDKSTSYYAEIELDKSDIYFTGPIEIRDGSGNIKGGFQFVNNENTAITKKKIKIIKLIYNNNSSTIDFKRIGENVNEKYFNQTNIFWEINEEPIEIKIDSSDIKDVIINKKVYSKKYIKTLFGATSVPIAYEDDYKSILLNLFKDKIEPLLKDKPEFYLVMMHNKMDSTGGFAISKFNCSFICSNWKDNYISHELGHNLKLDHIAYDFGECDLNSSNSMNTCPEQGETTNIMGYSNNSCDFYKHQRNKLINLKNE